MTLTVGSLFSGIGGLELGLEAAGMETRWQVEKDKYCRDLLAKHWPTVPRFEDVHDVGSHNLEPVDLICGGFPCQDVSHAGKRAGILRGNRSGLWYQFSRIIRELRPRFVVVENVSALLVHERGLDVVLGELAEIGYDAVWDCIPASAIGAPHRRDRVWIVGYARGESFHWLHDWSSGARGNQARPESLDAHHATRDDVADSAREHLEKRVDDGRADAGRAYGESAGSGARVADSNGERPDDAGSRASEIRGRRSEETEIFRDSMADADSVGRRGELSIEGGDGAWSWDQSVGCGEAFDVADAECEPTQLERVARVFYRARGILATAEGLPQSHPADGAGEDVADSDRGRQRSHDRDLHGREPDAVWSGEDVADANCAGLEGYPGHGGDGGGRSGSAGSVSARGLSRGAEEMADTSSDGRGESAERAPGSGGQFEWRGGSRGGYAGASNWTTEPDVGRVADGVSSHMDCLAGVPIFTPTPHKKKWAAGRVHRLKGLGNAVVPQVAEWLGYRILEAINV